MIENPSARPPSVWRGPFEATTRIYVGIVSSHLLAAHHLFELIKADPGMLPHTLAGGTKSTNCFPADARVVILIDLWGLPAPASEYLDAFVTELPRCAFLALDRARNEIDVAQLLRTGFAGFISHDEALHLLGPAINAVADGGVWAAPGAMRLYMNLTSPRAKVRGLRVRTLTVRENQILDLLRRRYSNRELANCLQISESTVKFHVSNVLMKLNVKNRRDLTDKELPFGAGPLSSMRSGVKPVLATTRPKLPFGRDTQSSQMANASVRLPHEGARTGS